MWNKQVLLQCATKAIKWSLCERPSRLWWLCAGYWSAFYIFFLPFIPVCLSFFVYFLLLPLTLIRLFLIDLCLSAFVCLFLKVSHFFCISLVRLQSIYPILSFILSFSSSFVIFHIFFYSLVLKLNLSLFFFFSYCSFFVRHSFLSFFFILSGYHHQFYLSVFFIVFHIVFPFFHISFVLY